MQHPVSFLHPFAFGYTVVHVEEQVLNNKEESERGGDEM